MASVSDPSGLGHFIVEESRGETFTPLLKSEPLEEVRFQSLSCELHRGPLWSHVIHGFVPGISWVDIQVPSLVFLSCGPVRYFESFEESSWSSVEIDVSDSLQEGVWVEVLGVDVELDVGFFMEFIMIEVLNSNAYIILN